MTTRLEDFAAWINKELGVREWRQADLARTSGVDPGYLSSILNGKKNPSPDACVSIAKALRIPPEFVFRKAGLLPELRQSGARKQLLEWLNIVNDDGIGLLLRIAIALGNERLIQASDLPGVDSSKSNETLPFVSNPSLWSRFVRVMANAPPAKQDDVERKMKKLLDDFQAADDEDDSEDTLNDPESEQSVSEGVEQVNA